VRFKKFNIFCGIVLINILEQLCWYRNMNLFFSCNPIFFQVLHKKSHAELVKKSEAIRSGKKRIITKQRVPNRSSVREWWMAFWTPEETDLLCCVQVANNLNMIYHHLFVYCTTQTEIFSEKTAANNKRKPWLIVSWLGSGLFFLE